MATFRKEFFCKGRADHEYYVYVYIGNDTSWAHSRHLYSHSQKISSCTDYTCTLSFTQTWTRQHKVDSARSICVWWWFYRLREILIRTFALFQVKLYSLYWFSFIFIFIFREMKWICDIAKKVLMTRTSMNNNDDPSTL